MLNIAICDDEKICLEEAKRAIQRYAKENNVSISLFTFDDGDSLIDSHKREPFDMVFLDIIMPLFNGMDLAHEIRENDSSVKIVFFYFIN